MNPNADAHAHADGHAHADAHAHAQANTLTNANTEDNTIQDLVHKTHESEYMVYTNTNTGIFIRILIQECEY